jgi:DNA-binding transcriptional MerR regulator
VTSNNPQDLDLFGDAIAAAPEKPVASKSTPKPVAEKSEAEKAPAPQKTELSASSAQPEAVADDAAKTVTAEVGEANDSVVPDKRYFTISEAAELCGAKPHVLRYWESEFKQLSPVKRAGNRRYYQRQDIFLIRQIRELLHEQGFTIAGAKQKLSGEHSKTELSKNKQILREVRQELEQLLKQIKS